jgi:hypothetical protein
METPSCLRLHRVFPIISLSEAAAHVHLPPQARDIG